MKWVAGGVFLFAGMVCCGTTAVRREAGTEVPQKAGSAEVDSTLEARKHYSFAKQYEQNEMYEDAVTQYRKALQFDLRSPKIHYSLGRLYYQLKQAPLAKTEFLWATRLDSAYADAHHMLARVYYDALHVDADYDSCLMEFERTAALRPDDPALRRVLVELYAFREQYEDALRHSVAVTRLEPQNIDAWVQRGELAVTCGQIDEAVVAYGEAWALDQDVRTLKILASLQYEAQRYEDALKSYEVVSASDPEDYDLLSRIASIHKKLGNAPKMIETLKRMVALRPEDLESVSQVAEWYLNAEELGRAKEWIDRGLKLNADDGRLLVLNGDYYLSSGQEDLGIAEYEKALDDPLWKANAQQRIWTVRPPLSEEEKKRQEFFNRGKENKDKNKE